VGRQRAVDGFHVDRAIERRLGAVLRVEIGGASVVMATK
jgi:hypothetical protein